MGGGRGGKGKRPADAGLGGAQSMAQQSNVSVTTNSGGGGDDDEGGEKKTRFIWSPEVGPHPLTDSLSSLVFRTHGALALLIVNPPVDARARISSPSLV